MISLNDLLLIDDSQNTDINSENDDLNEGGTSVLMCCGGGGKGQGTEPICLPPPRKWP